MPPSPRFPTTSWSLVLGTVEEEDRRSAFERLCNLYWSPVHDFIRGQVGDPESAKDLTQAFFARLIEKHDVCPPQPGKARFRCYLIAAIRHFLANESDRLRTQRRGGDWARVPLDGGNSPTSAEAAIADGMTPERIFERRWALLVIDRALKSVKRQYEAMGKRAYFVRLEIFLLGSRGDNKYRSVAEELGVSEAAVKMAVHRLRRQFGAALRAEISTTVGDAGEVDDELRYLLSVLNA